MPSPQTPTGKQPINLASPDVERSPEDELFAAIVDHLGNPPRLIRALKKLRGELSGEDLLNEK